MKQLCAAALALVVVGLAPARAEILEMILVKVNGEIFTKTDLEDRQIAYLRQQGQQIDPARLENDAELIRLLDEITPRILVDTVNELLILQRGREMGLRLTEDRFQMILDNIRQENQIESMEQFNQALENEGITMADLRRSIESQMVIAQVQQIEVLGRISITDAEAREYYQTNRERFTTPAEVTLREILIEVPPETTGGQPVVNVARDDEARARAEDIRERVLGGGDFGRIAARESDAPSRANGGLVGPVNPAELAPVFRETIDRLAVGEMSEAIRTPRGYHLLLLEHRRESTVMPFEEARGEIADRVYDQKRQGEYLRYLERLRQQAIIEWKSDDARRAFEQGLEQWGRPDGSTPSTF